MPKIKQEDRMSMARAKDTDAFMPIGAMMSSGAGGCGARGVVGDVVLSSQE